MNISFGKKIPISQTQVWDKKKNEYKNATFYEIDCKDSSDTEYIARKGGNWGFKYNISIDMNTKHNKLYGNGITTPIEKIMLENNKFYTLELDDGKLVSICETNGFKNYVNVHLLESDPSRDYKFAGQGILASIANMLAKEDDSELTVHDPVVNARQFYMEDCGFKPKDSRGLTMSANDMKEFVQKYERRTEKPIVNLVA